MDELSLIDAKFIEQNTDFVDLIKQLKKAFKENKTTVPLRHHHDFPNPKMESDSTLLLMPAWNPSQDAGVKIVTVSPENGKLDLPSIQGVYVYLNSKNGTLKSILDAKSLTVKRTAAASALASLYLSRENSSSLLMIGTGALSINLIKAHASVRPIAKVYVWGRRYEKAAAICMALKNESFDCFPIKTIEEKITDVDIISSATLSKTPLIFGKLIKEGQHLDLVGAYKKDMREADDDALKKASVFVDTFQGGLKESGDILIPLQNGTINKNDIKADLFQLCSNQKQGRCSKNEITFFKSVGHALEDLVAAKYYYQQYIND